jgi:hypothetical protein
MEKPTITDNGKLLLQFVTEKFLAENLSNEDLVQLIELSGTFLNLQTIPDYAKENNLSYNGVKKFRKIVSLFNIKFVLDNQ